VQVWSQLPKLAIITATMAECLTPLAEFGIIVGTEVRSLQRHNRL
jgi:hypothetical protein